MAYQFGIIEAIVGVVGLSITCASLGFNARIFKQKDLCPQKQTKEMCDERHGELKEDIKEIKVDVKTLLERRGPQR